MTCKRCEERGKTWEGSDPKCAFENGVFNPDNWNCATIIELRKIAYDNNLFHTYEEESISTLPLDSTTDSGLSLKNGFIVMNWYKDRGRTYNALYIHDSGYNVLTLQQAEDFLNHGEFKPDEKEILSDKNKLNIQFDERKFEDISSMYPEIEVLHPINHMLHKLKENNLLDIVDWAEVSNTEGLTESTIKEFGDKIQWSTISCTQKLSEEFIRDYQDKLDWDDISQFQKLSEDFIREFKDKVDWVNISYYQDYSEDFVRQFHDLLDWDGVSCYLKMSEEFINEFWDKLTWDDVIETNTHLRKEFIQELKERMNHTEEEPQRVDLTDDDNLIHKIEKGPKHEGILILKADNGVVQNLIKKLKENKYAFSYESYFNGDEFNIKFNDIFKLYMVIREAVGELDFKFLFLGNMYDRSFHLIDNTYKRKFTSFFTTKKEDK